MTEPAKTPAADAKLHEEHNHLREVIQNAAEEIKKGRSRLIEIEKALGTRFVGPSLPTDW